MNKNTAPVISRQMKQADMRSQTMNAYQEKHYSEEPTQGDFTEEEAKTALHRDENGTWRWVYEMEMLHNHVFLGFLMELILIPSALVFAVILFFSLRSGVSIRNLLMGYGILLCVLGAVALIIAFVHMIMAIAMGNREILPYEMNETEIAYGKGNARAVSVFRSVWVVREDRRNHRLILYSLFLINLICCEEKDYDFIADYIISRCTHAWILHR